MLPDWSAKNCIPHSRVDEVVEDCREEPWIQWSTISICLPIKSGAKLIRKCVGSSHKKGQPRSSGALILPYLPLHNVVRV